MGKRLRAAANFVVKHKDTIAKVGKFAYDNRATIKNVLSKIPFGKRPRRRKLNHRKYHKGVVFV